jgi:hypothetical protein
LLGGVPDGAPASQNPSSLKTLPAHIAARILDGCRQTGRQIIVSLWRLNRSAGNPKQRVVQGFKRAVLLPTTTTDTRHQFQASSNGRGLHVPLRNLEALRKRNADNVLCGCWVLRSITDPEAIDSPVPLAGVIRWSDGDFDCNPPDGMIVSTFGACFDSANQLYSGMMDRVYFSARATLQINATARIRSRDDASKYPIPTVSVILSQHTDLDPHRIVYILKCNSEPQRLTICFPRGDSSSHPDSDLNHICYDAHRFPRELGAVGCTLHFPEWGANVFLQRSCDQGHRKRKIKRYVSLAELTSLADLSRRTPTR